jgi:glycolate oxidase FAD binding subunit
MTTDPSSPLSPLASKLASSLSSGFAPQSQASGGESASSADMPAALARMIDQIKSAKPGRTILNIKGGGSKDFFGEATTRDMPKGPRLQVLDVRELAGITSYEPTELVVTARGGTSLVELEAALAEKGQCLPFDPPHFGPGTTVGGMVAAGLSGPARASVGSVRDYILGAKLLNGKGELLNFGGTVMKNVAGYDVARVLSGSMGTLGVLCEVSLKVLPIAPATITLRFDMDEAHALERLNAWATEPLPLNASVFWDGAMALRLRGARAAVDGAAKALGGEVIDAHFAQSFWRGLRDQTDEYFVNAKHAVQAGGALWRLSLPQTAPPMGLPGELMIEWGGAQRWLCTTAPAAGVRDAVKALGGHATLFRTLDKSPGVFAPLEPPLDRIHREIKKAFDPAGIFNPGRLYPQM